MRVSIRFSAVVAVAAVALATCGTASAVTRTQKVAGASTVAEMMRAAGVPRVAGALVLPGQARPASASQDDALNSVSCVTAANCMAVGLSNTNNDGALAETWNGKAWKTVSVPVPVSNVGALTGVSCTSATRCVAVGTYSNADNANGSLLVETWNGKAWTIAPVPQGSGGALTGVSCATAKSCVAVGFTVNASGTSLIPIAESWNGAKWSLAMPPAVKGSTVSVLVSVSCASAAYCVAVGGDLTTTELYSAYSALIETWNGKTWTRVNASAPAISILEGVSCVSAARCVAAGAVGTAGTVGTSGFAELWDGRAWRVTKVAWPAGTGDSLIYGVSCASARSCVAIGITGFNENSDNNSGTAAAASWNGSAWRVTSVPSAGKGTASSLISTACPSPADCVAVGRKGPDNSVDLNSLTGFWNGKSWRLVAAP
jgi:hypothetical protein